MKTAYFDCCSGISGNMILGALLDLGLSKNKFIENLKSLKIDFDIDIKKVKKQEIVGCYVEIKSNDKKERDYKEIVNIIEKSKLKQSIKTVSKNIFKKLFSAEAKVHNKKFNKIHLHELSSADAIIDIVGSCMAIEELEIEKIYSSPLNLGSGFVNCKHGILPVPAPAVLELVKGFPVYSTDIKEELTTPTGAAIITTIAEDVISLPEMRIEKIGYGAGTKDLSVPNFLRIYLGEKSDFEKDKIFIIETNIDDSPPYIYDYLFEKAFAKGALDVYLTPVIMKKTRPGVCLTVICEKENLEKLQEIIFSETTTIGLRISSAERKKLKREIININTEFGKIKFKRVNSKNYPEYEECKRIAKEYNLPLKEVFKKLQR